MEVKGFLQAAFDACDKKGLALSERYVHTREMGESSKFNFFQNLRFNTKAAGIILVSAPFFLVAEGVNALSKKLNAPIKVRDSYKR